MPKSKRRKGAKKYLQRSSKAKDTGHSSQPFSMYGETEPKNVLSSLGSKLVGDRLSSSLLWQIIFIFPLVSGCWITGGLEIKYPAIFTCTLALVLCLYYLQSARASGSKAVCVALLATLMSGLVILALLTTHFWLSILGTLFVILGLLRIEVGHGAGKRIVSDELVAGILISGVSLVGQMSILPVLAGFAQHQKVFLELSVIGFAPACFLFASVIAKSSPVFEKAGWQRKIEVLGKNGPEIRPSGLTRLFTLLLVLGPLPVICLSPLGYLPAELLLLVLPLYALPSLGSRFLESLGTPETFERSCIKLSLLVSILALLAGVLSGL